MPSKIWEDILTRLNVKTLTRCKCVSKGWFNLISSPYFQDLHCFRSQQNLHLLSRSILYYHNDFGFNCQFSSMNMNVGGAIHTTFTALVDGPIKLILPNCWGLVCCATQTRIYVYNPATLRLVALPSSPNFDSATTMCGFGFGYVRFSKCYRVVQFIYGKSTQRIECSIMQLGRRANSSELSWRVLEHVCPYFVEEFSLSAFARETIYWNISRNQTRRDNDDILSFNIKKDELYVIPHPPDWIHTPHNWMQLVNLDSRLCLLQISPSHIAIWVRRDHQWHRGGFIDIKAIDRTHVGQIMYIKNGELIFASFRNYLLLYDIKKRSFKRLHFPFIVYGLAIYWETLFPLGDSHY
ncbi:F-box and associated interaction domains-containing protein [Euphorbia peplus]|nr:F-box and associated interaction domains-containing protein [Euphorbia peplus]